ncbi:hypothetical protein [Gallibacterium salpingitidis]|uniref:Uncharacterized protein n=1 Tax=Gallibacterium salpingitidis TaxID=505341 RepID=A0A1A7NXF0_9PAST|nr:hypothetical protein [Gallibacterium salpingitidis]OBW94265.1 hypothetical protein QS62_06525 [Gallibacterium salpingitidis]
MDEKIFGLALLFLVGLFFYFCFHIDPDASLISKLILFPLGIGIIFVIYCVILLNFVLLLVIAQKDTDTTTIVVLIGSGCCLWAAKTTFVYFFL